MSTNFMAITMAGGSLSRSNPAPDGTGRPPILLSNDEHRAWRMPSDSFRDAAEQNTINAIAAMAADHNKIGRPVAGGGGDRLNGGADGDELDRFRGRWRAPPQAGQDLQDLVIWRLGQLGRRNREPCPIGNARGDDMNVGDTSAERRR